MNRKKKIETILKKNFLGWKAIVNDISILHKGHNNFDSIFLLFVFKITLKCVSLLPS